MRTMSGLSKINRLIPVVLLAGVLLAGSGFAQKKDKNKDSNIRTLQGLVTDAADNPIAGAIVQLENTKTLQIRSFITKEKGDYFFSDLSTDVDYRLHAENHGMTSSTKVLSSFDSRKAATMNLKVDQQMK